MGRRRRPDGLAVLVTGSRGSGKSAWTIQQNRDKPRLLVWDAVREWSRLRLVSPVRTLHELHKRVSSDLVQPGPFRIGYIGPVNPDNFEVFCRLASVWTRGCAGTCVVEELADVTAPGKAPDAWGAMVRKGRHDSGEVYALTQRPAESDKTIAGNADIIHAGRQSFPRDRKTMAEYLDVPLTQVTALTNLDWIERDMRDGTLRSGRMTFKSRR